jgi:SAM-dependent methyltransferase
MSPDRGTVNGEQPDTRLEPPASAYLDATAVEWYDIAFDWRRDKEADFAETCLQAFGRKTQGAVLDLACGGGQFLHEMQQRGWTPAGVDLSPQMIHLARRRLGNACALETACISDFTFRRTFDVATCWSDSLCYLLSNDQIIRHLQCVGQVLESGGLYLVDIGFSRWAEAIWHARQDDWRPDFSTGWRAARGQLEVYHDGCDGPPCDGLTHVCTEYLHFRVTDLSAETTTERTFTAWKRALHPQEFAALVSASDGFDVVEWFSGTFSLGQTLESTHGRGRGLVLLRKRQPK